MMSDINTVQFFNKNINTKWNNEFSLENNNYMYLYFIKDLQRGRFTYKIYNGVGGYTTKQLYKNECSDDNGNMNKIGWYKTLHNTPPNIWQLPRSCPGELSLLNTIFFNQPTRQLYFCDQPIRKLYFCDQPIRKLYFCDQQIRKLYFCNQPIRKLYFCNVIIKMHEGAVKIFTATFSLADHEFILI